MSNPFIVGSRINDPVKFFGRKLEIYQVISRLKNMQSTAIVGERRIGKSSLLYHLYQTGTSHLGDKYSFIYAELTKNKYHASVYDLFKNVLAECGVEFAKKDSIQQHLIVFEETVKELTQSGKKIVLLFDEFEELIQHRTQFPEDFFDELRAALNDQHLAIITGTKKPLKELSEEKKLSSPFHNVFKVLELSEFTIDEASEFIAHDWGIDPFSEDEISFIISYPQFNHPLVLQAICSWVVDNRQFGYNEMTLEEKIRKDVESYFSKGFLSAARRNKSALIEEGKTLWEMAKDIFTSAAKKRLGG